MPNGDQVQFPDDMPKDQIRSLILSKFPDAGKQAAAAAPDDHGLAHRQAMTAAEKAVSPITEYPRNYTEMNKEARDQISRGAGQLYEGAFGSGIMGDVGKFAGGLGNVALGTLGYVGSPISAAYRSVIGQPVEDVTGIPREYTEFASQLATPGIGLTKLPKAPGLPVTPGGTPRIYVGKPGSDLPPTGPSGTDAALAMQRLREQGIDIDAPRAITSDNTGVQRTGQGLSKVPIVGDPLAVAVQDTLPAQIRKARDTLAEQRGSATEANAADRAATFIADKAAAETKAANDAHQQAIDQANAAIDAREAQSAQSVEARTGTATPQDTGALATERLRAAEAAAKAEKDRLYDVAGQAEGTIKSEGVRGISDRIDKELVDSEVYLDYKNLTDKSIKMMDDIKRFENGEFPGAPPVKAEVPPAGIGHNRPPVEAAPPAAAPAAPTAQSLTEFLASKGGLGPDSELGAIGADRHVVDVAGAGKRRLVKQGGWTLDYAREAAEEAGYLKPGPNGTSTTRDLLDALDKEMRGNKLYPEGMEGTVGKREATAMSERARHEYDAHLSGLEDDLHAAGYDKLGPDVKQRAINLMDKERLDPDTAVEHAIHQLEQEDNAVGSGFPGDRAGAPAAPAAVPFGKDSGLTLQGVERFRKSLRRTASDAERGSEDERAAKHILDKFDAWQEDAMQKSLLSGDPKALEKFQAARAANRDWRERFGYNEKRDVNNLVQKILHQDVTTKEVADYLIGSGKVGKQGVSARLYESLMNATGNSEKLAQSIKGAIWDKLSSSSTAAKDIREFLHYSTKDDLAGKVFSPEERSLMLKHADVLDQAKAARDAVGQFEKTGKPEPGPLQQLASRIIGGKMDKGEALWKTIEGYTRKGGDLKALGGLMREIPPGMKDDIAGAVIRGLGRDQAGNFSLDRFASDWGGHDASGKITPQAKAILFGNAGPHVTALNDLATIAQRLKEVKGKYGNPSGTGQTNAFFKLAAALGGFDVTGHFVGFGPAIGAAALGGVGNIGARVLASPAGAASIAKYARALEAQAKAPSPATNALVNMTQRNLANTVRALSAAQAVRAPAMPGVMRSIQGPVPAGAQNEQR